MQEARTRFNSGRRARGVPIGFSLAQNLGVMRIRSALGCRYVAIAGLLQPLCTARGILTLAALCGALGFYHCSSWRCLRRCVAKILTTVLILQGRFASVDGCSIHLGTLRVDITPGCTYVLLLFCAVPLLWQGGRVVNNLLRVGTGVVLLFILNIVRLWLAVMLRTSGISWFWAHDAIHWFVAYGAFGILVARWLMVNGAGIAPRRHSPAPFGALDN